MTPERIRVGIDTGGTFTDFIVIRGGRVEVFKEFSTPDRPEDAILKGMSRLKDCAAHVIHGSTVATNALLERRGAKTALVTTAGFEDVLAIGRQTRRALYTMDVRPTVPLVPDELRIGAFERVLFDGAVQQALDPHQMEQIVRLLQSKSVESVAVCFLFSFANPRHEQEMAAALSVLGVPVSISSHVLPEYREYERTSTTVVNAYLAPRMGRYLGGLEARLRAESLRVMQSNGGVVRARTVSEFPVHAVLSGPAGGVVGAFHVARMAGFPNILTLDMGGTSTDVALCHGSIVVTHEGEVDGLPVGTPMIDLHTVGAGGGSIAELDPGGMLQVGPRSAGASPGPICYGHGDQFTVTDANAALGRLQPRFFLGGSANLNVKRIAPVAASLAWTRRWKSLQQLAQGVIDVVNNHMEQAIRLVSVERGHDPRDFVLVCFGGAGGLHAAELARGLGIDRVLIPRFPGALSALGLLLADVKQDYSRTLRVSLDGSARAIQRILKELHRSGFSGMKAEGFQRRDVRCADSVDLRYEGQSYELTVPLRRGFEHAFHTLHAQRYGHASPDKPVELVNVRSTFTGLVPKPRFRKATRSQRAAQSIDEQPVWLDGKWHKTPVYDRDTLRYGQRITGPALIGEYSSTTLVPAGFFCEVDAYLNLMLIRGHHD